MRKETTRIASHGLSLLAPCACSILSACGFHLEGLSALPDVMTVTYLDTSAPYTAFFGSLRDVLRTRGSRIVESRQEAQAVLSILEDNTGQRVLSVSARNVPREYEIFYTVTFSLQAGEQHLIEAESLVVTRTYTYDENRVLGKSAEEGVLRRALAADLARQVVRRIQATGTLVQAPDT